MGLPRKSFNIELPVEQKTRGLMPARGFNLGRIHFAPAPASKCAGGG
jgi:hypothetical protein